YKNKSKELSSQVNVKTVEENGKEDEKKTYCGKKRRHPSNETDGSSQIEDKPGHSTPINKQISTFRSKTRLSKIPKYGMSSVINSIQMNEKSDSISNNIHSENDSKSKLIELPNQLNVKSIKENEKEDEKKIEDGEIIKHPNNETNENSQIEDKPGHSTPIDKQTSIFRRKIRISEIPKYGICSVVNSINMNEKSNSISDNIQSENTSPLPSGASEILQFMGDSWLKDQSGENNTSKDFSSALFDDQWSKNDSNCEINHRGIDDIQESEDAVNKKYESVMSNSSPSEEKNLTYDVNNSENEKEFPIDQNNFESEFNLELNENDSNNNESDSQMMDDHQNDGAESESMSSDDEQINDPDYLPETSVTVENSHQQSIISNISTEVKYSGPPLDIRELKVLHSQSDGKTQMKKDFCLYCKKLITKLPRHLKDKHRKEDRVKEFLGLPNGWPRKRQQIHFVPRY
ncbi:hypothetical protein PV327_008722, partial [Microctonus hyperodae]